MRESGKGARVCLGICAAVIWGLTWYFSTRQIDLVIAWDGWSAIDWVSQMKYPENYTKNFPAGIQVYQHSAFMRIYPWADSLLGIGPEVLVYWVVAFEIGFLGFAVWKLVETIQPNTPQLLRLGVVFLAVCGNGDALDLGRFGTAHTLGLYYGTANALRLLGIVMAIRRRFVWAAVLIALSFMTHAIEGLIAAAFVVAMQATAPPREVANRSGLLGMMAFSAVAAIWLLGFQQVAFSGGSIPNELWILLTKAFSVHWYPVEYGLFDLEHTERFMPLLAFVLLLVHYFPRSPWIAVQRKVVAGLVAVLILSCVGVLISWLVPIPFLIKVSLHRATLLFYLVAMPYVFVGLWRDVIGPSAWRAALAIGTIVSPFLLKPGFPILLAVALVGPSALLAIRERNWSLNALAKAGLICVIVAILAAYALAGALAPWSIYFGGRWIAALTVVGFLGLWLLAYRKDIPGSPSAVAGAAAACLMILCASISLYYKGGPRVESVPARAFRNAQLWASANTSPTSLFMVDPSIYYGWRDYSKRSSFGNLREWLHTSWAYDSRSERYAEGMRRFEEFQLPLPAYLGRRRPLSGFVELTSAVREKFYASSCEWQARLAERYEINYFVFMKDRVVRPPCFLVAYENEGFFIVRVPRRD